ncbi:MAG TPA: hypothetical protein VEW69_03865 [Alphaproteobacteria bacterium]|nr:hypothetical protein [Alphaproteobacteria bacterium]
MPKAVWAGRIQTGTHQNPDGTTEPVTVETTRLFHPRIGSHGLELPSGMVLLMTSFDHSEACEDLFHGHPEVAILPHPTLGGTLMLKEVVKNKEYKFTQAHLDALMGNSDLAIKDTDTVLDVARKASAIHPELRFRNVL